MISFKKLQHNNRYLFKGNIYTYTHICMYICVYIHIYVILAIVQILFHVIMQPLSQEHSNARLQMGLAEYTLFQFSRRRQKCPSLVNLIFCFADHTLMKFLSISGIKASIACRALQPCQLCKERAARTDFSAGCCKTAYSKLKDSNEISQPIKVQLKCKDQYHQLHMYTKKREKGINGTNVTQKNNFVNEEKISNEEFGGKKKKKKKSSVQPTG